MQIILLSGGSGKRLWPLSNEARSKQFLKLLTAPDGSYESILQRITRQIRESKIDAKLTIATSILQYDSIINQLGNDVDIVTEPTRRDTFPAIALSSSYLLKEKKCSCDEVVVIMPSDSYISDDYFDAIIKMATAAEKSAADIILMGITPTEPSSKYGYIVPNDTKQGEICTVNHFIEKPDREIAKELIAQGGVWNGGVFAFKLGYISDIIEKYIKADSFSEIRTRYAEFPKNSFDYEVVENTSSIAFVPYSGEWNDLGTWNTLSNKIDNNTIGNAVVDKSKNTHIINELATPIICLGVENLMIAASPDGILVSNKEATTELKNYADKFTARPMYEERRWGKYLVMGHEHFKDGHNALTKLLYLNAGCNISYQYHNKREEIWTFVDGEGILILDGESILVTRGYVAHIKQGQKHAVKAITDLQIIEVQTGTDLIEEDIIRLEWEW
ncbi:MAG: sugar phosphate nucleotidyltransferase [bacterium]